MWPSVAWDARRSRRRGSAIGHGRAHPACYKLAPLAPHVSVIVRTRNEERTVERALSALLYQTVVPEIIVVDSGSEDRTVKIARSLCDRVIEISPAEFTYGRALNIGARAATASIHFALSAHCFPERADWVERSLAHYQRSDVAATNGIDAFADRSPVREPFFQNAAHARSNPFWGFSNHASSWRADVWMEFPFDEDIDYAEDREWSWRVLDAGWVIVFDPALWVDRSHAWRGGAVDLYNRQRSATAALGTFAELPPYGVQDCVREWWSGFPRDRDAAWGGFPPDGRSPLFHRLNYRRIAGLAGKYVGHRLARRRGHPA